MRLIDADAMKSVKFIQSGNFNSIETFRAWIDSAPTVESAPQWIPCSERLPEDNQQCLIYHYITGTNLKMTTGVYHSDRQVFTGLRHGTALKDAIAWMPLPIQPESEV